MGMNGLDSAKCQNQDKSGHDGNYGIVNEKETKSQIVVFSNGKQKTCRGQKRCSRLLDFISRERVCSFSLDFLLFGPSVLDEARSKVALRGESYGWVSIWWSSDNSKRYGSFPTCDIIWLRAMFMVRDIPRLDLAVNSVSKPLNRVEKIPNLVVVNSNSRVSLFT